MKMKKRRNYPIKYRNWGIANYPMREEDDSVINIKSGDSERLSHTILHTTSTMRQRYLTNEPHYKHDASEILNKRTSFIIFFLR